MKNSSYQFKKIRYDDVLEIEKWRYYGFEKRLYMDVYHESYIKKLNPLLGPRNCLGYTAFYKNELFGLMEFYFESDGVHLGLGINPIFIGKLMSRDFILSGIDFLRSNFDNVKRILLEVDIRNIQAIKAYEKAGFKLLRKVDNELHYIYPV